MPRTLGCGTTTRSRIVRSIRWRTHGTLGPTSRGNLGYSCRMSAASPHTRRNVMTSRSGAMKAFVWVFALKNSGLRQIDRTDDVLLAAVGQRALATPRNSIPTVVCGGSAGPDGDTQMAGFGANVSFDRQRRRVGSPPIVVRGSGVCMGSRAAVVARLMARPVCPQLRKCRVRPGSYAWCQFRTSCSQFISTRRRIWAETWSHGVSEDRVSRKSGCAGLLDRRVS